MWWKSINRKAILTLLLCIMAFFGSAQSANDAFNAGAKEYISGSKELAKQIVSNALLQYPNDPKLTKLLEKIKEEQEQDKQNQQQNKENQDKQDKENKDEQDKGEENKEDKENQPDENQEDKDKPDENKDENENPDNSDGNEKEQDKKPKAKPGQISRDDAERLLEALSKEEQEVQKKINEKKIKGKPVNTEKDW